MIEEQGDETAPAEPIQADDPKGRWTRFDLFALIGITLTGALLRLVRLADPKSLVFDETYYAKDACWYVYASASACDTDTEITWVHPPLGKWLLAIGIRIFGYDSFGWRIMAVVAGAVTIALLYLLAKKLFRSTIAAALSSGLLAVDLLHFVQSRTAMLDIFVPLFGVAAILFVVYDRDRIFEPPEGEKGVRARSSGLLDRPWRLAAGAAAGAAVASKWSGGFILLAVILLTVAWEITARRDQGDPHPILDFFKRESASIVVGLVLVPLAVYAFTFIGRDVSGEILANPISDTSMTGSFVQRQLDMADFHKNLESHHSYESPPWSWLLLKRPVSYFFETAENGDYKEIFVTGSPFVWWTSILALVFTFLRWIWKRDPLGPEGVIVAGFLFTYVLWLLPQFDRPAVFIFYLLPAIPFMCLAIGYVSTLIGNSWEAKAATALFSIGAIGFFIFYYPLLTKAAIPQPDWDRRVWIFDNCDMPEQSSTTATVTQTNNGEVTTSESVGTSEETLPPPGWCWI